jgi:hypothetical protein
MEVHRRLGIGHQVQGEAALIFRRPGTMAPAVTVQRIDRDVATAERMLEQRPSKLAEVVALLGPGQSLDNPRNILRLSANFVGACRSFCPLWHVCLNEARRCGRPAALGTQVEELVASVGTFRRAQELMHGATPSNDVELHVQRRLHAGLHHLREATS